MTRNHQASAKHRKAGGRRSKGIAARGISTAEKIHRSVAAFPLDVLERIERLEKPVGRLRKLQDQSITGTYDMLRGVNKEVALLLRDTDGSKKTKRRSAKTVERPLAEPVQHPAPAAAVS